MTTTILDRVPLDVIGGQAREVRFGRAVLTLIAGVLFGAGWLSARGFAVVWLAGCWCAVAVREGWRASHGPSRATRLESLLAEVESLRDQVRRLGG